MVRHSPKTAEGIAAAIADLAKELGVEPAEVTRDQLIASGRVSDHSLRRAGGFSSIRGGHFPPETTDLRAKYGGKLVASHLQKIEREHGRALFFERELLEAVKASLAESPLLLHRPLKKPAGRAKAQKTKRTIVACLSDTHFGANVTLGETHGQNEFNWTIAARRLAHFVSQVAGYKLDHRAQTDLVLQINGDILAGLIHNQEWFVDLLTTQFHGSLSLLVQAVSYLATQFSSVRVACTPGNHGRSMAKSDKGRATTHKWDSYETMLFLSLKAVLAKQHWNVEVMVPEAPFLLYRVQGHLLFQTHGDTVVNVGNPGKSLNIASIAEQVGRINSSDLLKAEEALAVLCVGHVHTPTAQLMDNGCVVVVNGCLSGSDPFAQAIGIFSSNPCQMLFESTAEHAVGDLRMIRLKKADGRAELDAIVKPSVFPDKAG